MKSKVCSKCEEEKDVTEFYYKKYTPPKTYKNKVKKIPKEGYLSKCCKICENKDSYLKKGYQKKSWKNDSLIQKGLKVCSKCKTKSTLNNFSKDNNIKCGYSSWCKSCQNNKEKKEKERQKRREKNPEYYDFIDERKILLKKGKCRCIKCKIIKPITDYSNSKYKSYCIKCTMERDKERRVEKLLNLDSEYFIKKEGYRKTKVSLDKLNKRIWKYIRNSIKRKEGYNNNSIVYSVLGCTYEEFKLHIESQWEEWMNWDNYGKYNGEERYGWDFDHIIPKSIGKCEEDIIRLNHHSNIQPLCSYVNRVVKRDKIEKGISNVFDIVK